MFALNATMNANKYYGTNADFHILYNPSLDEDYRKRCETAFPFEVRWIELRDANSSFHNAKYKHAASLADEYDAVCLIDADEFVCCDTKKYFEKVAKKDLLISATHAWSGLTKEQFYFDNPELIIDRCFAWLADFPVFINPKFGKKMFEYWYENSPGTSNKEYNHPLVAFNRAVAKFMKPEQVQAIDGKFWVSDYNYWTEERNIDGDKLVDSNGNRIYAVHNKWWKLGASSGEWINSVQSGIITDDYIERLDRGERNMNNIKTFMEWFNDMTPATRRDDYLKEPIDRKKYLESIKDLGII